MEKRLNGVASDVFVNTVSARIGISNFGGISILALV